MPTLNTTPDTLLRRHQMHVTGPRKKVLEAFLVLNTAVTQEDIQRYCIHSMDRVTLYRTLSLFMQAGIIHLLPVVDGVNRYSLSSQEVQSEDNHLHFICERCKKTYCLYQLFPPEMQLPADFLVTKASFILKGICNACNPLQKTIV